VLELISESNKVCLKHYKIYFIVSKRYFLRGYSCAVCVPLWVRCCLVLGAGNVMCHVSGTDSNCSGIPNSCHLPEQKNAYKLQTS